MSGVTKGKYQNFKLNARRFNLSETKHFNSWSFGVYANLKTPINGLFSRYNFENSARLKN